MIRPSRNLLLNHHRSMANQFLYSQRSFATEAKTAIKSKRNATQEADMPPLEPFYGKPNTKPNIPDVSDMTPDQLGIRWRKHWDAPHHIKMRGIDVALREQYDEKDLWTMFSQEMNIGSVMLVESVTSRTAPRKQSVAGVVIDKQFCGVASHFTFMYLVAGSLIKQQIPLYNPNVLRFCILGKFNKEDLVQNGILNQGSINQIFDDHEAKIKAVAEELKLKSEEMNEKREKGLKAPIKKVQNAYFKSQYLIKTKQLIKELRRDTKTLNRGSEPNREWKGWSEIDELKQRSI